MINYVCNVEPYEVFDYLNKGFEVYVTTYDSDKFINLRYEMVISILKYISCSNNAFFYIRWGDNDDNLEK